MVRPTVLRCPRVPATHFLSESRYSSSTSRQTRLQTDIQGIEQAKKLYSVVEESPIFENVTPRSLTLVVFRLKPQSSAGGKESTDAELNLLNTQFHNRLNARNDTFLTQTILHSVEREIFCIRFALGGWRTKMEDVEKIWAAVEEEGKLALAEWDSKTLSG
jgi:aromatic-L-amino-acid decarboxylase